jgi:hypothetical protein
VAFRAWQPLFAIWLHVGRASLERGRTEEQRGQWQWGRNLTAEISSNEPCIRDTHLDLFGLITLLPGVILFGILGLLAA